MSEAVALTFSLKSLFLKSHKYASVMKLFFSKKQFHRKQYILGLPGTIPSQRPKKQKKSVSKKFLIFPEIELSSSNIKKKFLYFLERKLFLYFLKWKPALFSPSLKNKKKIHSGKIFYTSGNRNSKKASDISSGNLQTLKIKVF